VARLLERPAWTIGLAVFLGILAHLPGVHGGFVDYDTGWLVARNPVLSPGELSALPDILWGMGTGTRLTLGAEYLPIRDLTVLLDFALFGDSWAGHHAVNLAWYLVGCGLMAWIFARLLGPGLPATLAAAWFAVHPTHVESVAWLASRKDVVSLAFFALSVALFLRLPGPRGAAVAALTGIIAYWAKNTAIVLPVLLVVISLWRGDDWRRPRWWLQWLPAAALFGAALALTMRIGASVSMFSAPRGDGPLQIATISAQVLWRYLGQLAWPANLSALYPEPVAGSALWLLVPAGLLAGIALAARRRSLISLGLLWFLISLAPVSQILPIQNLQADRYLLLPSAGLALAVAAAVPALPSRLLPSRLLPVLLAGLIALTWTSAERSRVWRSGEALWGDVVETYPELPRAWSSLAGAQAPETARTTLDRALAIHPDHPQLLQSRGTLAMQRGDLADAEEDLRATLEREPDRRKARNNLAVLLIRTGRPDEAIREGQHLVQTHPLYVDGWNTLGTAHLQTRELGLAAAALERAHALAPLDPRPLYNLGSVSWLVGDRDGARRWWRQTVAVAPAHALATEALERTAPATAGAPTAPDPVPDRPPSDGQTPDR